MKLRAVLWIVAVCFLAPLLGSCSKFPTLPANRNPVLVSVEASVDSLGPADSLVVTVHATDPDGDELVYDWFTDGRLIIKGARPGDTSRYNTVAASQTFYRSAVIPYNGTAWVSVYARDRVGGASRDTQVVVKAGN
jgi:hypothetical protein